MTAEPTANRTAAPTSGGRPSRPGRDTTGRSMSLQLHRPDGRGGIEPRPVGEPNWRGQLQSKRWGMNRRDGRLPGLKNPEMNPTSTPMAVLFWVGLGGLTFLLLVAGYGTGFWQFAGLTVRRPGRPRRRPSPTSQKRLTAGPNHRPIELPNCPPRWRRRRPARRRWRRRCLGHVPAGRQRRAALARAPHPASAAARQRVRRDRLDRRQVERRRRRLAPAAAAPIDAASMPGTWTIAASSIVGYRVRERLASLSADSDAVGRTNWITGTATIAASGGRLSVTDASFSVDMTSLASDRAMRDNRLRNDGIQTDRFPTSTFKLTQPVALPADGHHRGGGRRHAPRRPDAPRRHEDRRHPGPGPGQREHHPGRRLAVVPVLRLRHQCTEHRRLRPVGTRHARIPGQPGQELGALGRGSPGLTLYFGRYALSSRSSSTRTTASFDGSSP